MKIGFTELILVVIVAFVVIGPDKLPEYARKLGKMLRELKKYTGAASEEIQKNVVEPLNEIQAPSMEAVAPLTDLKKDIDDSMKDVTKSFTNIGKTSKEEAKKAEEAEEVTELEDAVEELPEEPAKAEAAPAEESAKAEEAPAEAAEPGKAAEKPAETEAPAPAAEAAPAHEAEAAAEKALTWLRRTPTADVVLVTDPLYPKELIASGTSDVLLFVRGRRETLARPRVTLLISAKADAEGRRNLKDFAAALAENGVTAVLAGETEAELTGVAAASQTPGGVIIAATAGPDRVPSALCLPVWKKAEQAGLILTGHFP